MATTENMESRITITVPAGTFKDCVREHASRACTNPSDITDKSGALEWESCKDTSDGELVASDALPRQSDIASFVGKHHREPRKQTCLRWRKSARRAATKTALEEVPGKATSMKIERSTASTMSTPSRSIATKGRSRKMSSSTSSQERWWARISNRCSRRPRP